MLRWNRDYHELLAPYYSRLEALIETGPSADNEGARDFFEAVRERKPTRPLQYAWLALQSLPEDVRAPIINAFGKVDQQKAKRLSDAANARIQEKIGRADRPDDFYREMLDQAITPPEFKLVEPLGTREQHYRERARGRNNSR